MRTTALPDWIKFGLALLIVGGIAEAFGKVSKTGGYMFAFLVVLGYAATHDRAVNLAKFLDQIGISASPDSSGGNPPGIPVNPGSPIA